MDNAGLSFMDEVFALLLDGPTSNEDAQSGIESLATIGPRGGRKQRRRRRRRPKDELDALRNEIEELRNRRKQLRSPPVLDDDADSGWREVALSQRCQAERAREANRQLRELLEQQGELAQDLWHKLQIRIRAMCVERPELRVPKQLSPSQYDVYASPSLFASLTDKLDGVYARLEGEFDSVIFESAQSSSTRESAFLVNDQGPFFEIRCQDRLPFPPAAMHHVVGKGITLNTSSQLYSTCKHVDQDTIQYAFSQPTHCPEAIMTSKMAIRRQHKGSRVVIVWTGVVNIEGETSINVKEEGWEIAEPADSSSKSMVIRKVIRVIPELTNATTIGEQRKRAEQMANPVFDAYRWLVTHVSQTSENVLLADFL